jgi:hypothetical protein
VNDLVGVIVSEIRKKSLKYFVQNFGGKMNGGDKNLSLLLSIIFIDLTETGKTNFIFLLSMFMENTVIRRAVVRKLIPTSSSLFFDLLDEKLSKAFRLHNPISNLASKNSSLPPSVLSTFNRFFRG